MDTQKFDAIAKTLASGTSRRSVIGGMVGGALAMAGLSRAAAKPADKVDICHYDSETDSFHLINVSGNAVDAHMGHGDVLYEPSTILATFALDPKNPNAVDTGVLISDGESVHVTITGVAGWCCNLQLDANGSAPCGSPLTPFPCGSVVGAIGGGSFRINPADFSVVGTEKTVTANGISGNLFLQYVDGCSTCYGDNNGSLQVTIRTVPPC